MNFSQVIILIMGIFTLIGALDRIFGNHFNLGSGYENGIKTAGELVLSMVGIMVLSPVIKSVCAPIITPFFNLIGVDPSVFAGSILACDMGGAPLAYEFANTDEAAKLSGILISSTLGVTVSFTIPVSLMVTRDEDKSFAAKGILCGVITIPIGVFFGGIVAGIQITDLIINILPVILISAIIVIGLLKFEKIILITFVYFGRFIVAIATIGLACAGFELITGITLIKGLGSINDAFVTVGSIAIVLSGAFPLIAIIKKILCYPASTVENKFGLNGESIMGLIATLANSIATFGMIEKMNSRGKIINMAFAVSGAFVFGDHLAFTSDFAPDMIPAMIVCKLTAGILSVIVAYFITKERKNV